jgi:ribosome biogenesis GTPase A
MRQEKKNNNQEEKLTKVGINWYPGHMAKAKRQILEKINFIDVVLEVIDARIPMSSKIIDIDTYTKNKPRILIMTKYDLCDKAETNKWIIKYEKEGYTVIPINLFEDSINKIITEIMNIMEQKNQSRENKGMSTRRARVLVLGIPNVGKSTLINRLVGKKTAVTGNRPGVTKNLNWIRINESLELLDTPGILWPKFEDKVALNLASLTAIKEEILPLDEVAIYVLNTLAEYYPTMLEERYGISSIEEDICITLDEIGKRRGCLMKGGIVDYEKVYSIILKDLKDGVIKNITFDRI